MTGLGALSLALTACGGSDDSAAAAEEPVETGEEALKRLLEGNDRYIADKSKPINEGKDRREKLTKRQRPFALIFSCVDSRVPPELVFDRGLGDLFVIRTAGEVLDSAVLGSIEYGVAELEIPLVVVLGHTACGAVKATVGSLASGERPPDEIAYLVDAIAPAVAKAKEKMKPVAKSSTKKSAATTTTAAAATEETTAPKSEGKTTTTVAAAPDPTAELVAASIQANVELVIDRLSTVPILAERLKKDRLLIAGGVYNLETGVVDVTVHMPEDLKTERAEAAAKAGGEKKAEGEGGATTVAGATTTAKASH